ncbi:MAG: response regulator [Bacteroidetes bacterium]|nr:response regulator [Bacteroidota bacterium]
MQQNIEIILIEDNKSDAELILRALKKNNLINRIIHLKDGEEALNYFFGNENSPAKNDATPKVILLDLKMPKVNGIEVLKKMKSNERTKKIPVVVLTSSREDPDIRVCYELGVNSYVVKPVQFDQFVKAVSELGLYWTLINQPPN